MYNQIAIDMLQPGDVLVVDLFGQAEGGTIVGDNLFYYIMKTTKTGGIVVDGAVRDLEGISEMEMPAYFLRTHPSAIANVTLTGINIPVRIGNVTVMPGDLVLGDAEGVYFIPPQLAQAAVDNADVVCARVEDWLVRDLDLVCARALAPLVVLVEYAAPILRIGGSLVACAGCKANSKPAASTGPQVPAPIQAAAKPADPRLILSTTTSTVAKSGSTP